MDIVALNQHRRSPWHQASGASARARTKGGMAERVVEGEVLGGGNDDCARGSRIPPRESGYASPLARGLAAYIYIDNVMLAAASRQQGLIDCYV